MLHVHLGIESTGRSVYGFDLDEGVPNEQAYIRLTRLIYLRPHRRLLRPHARLASAVGTSVNYRWNSQTNYYPGTYGEVRREAGEGDGRNELASVCSALVVLSCALQDVRHDLPDKG